MTQVKILNSQTLIWREACRISFAPSPLFVRYTLTTKSMVPTKPKNCWKRSSTMISASLLQAQRLLSRRVFSSSSQTCNWQGAWWCSEIVINRQQQPQQQPSLSALSSSWGATTNQHHQRCYFSSEPSISTAQDDKPLIPGIGRGKTSTGLVSSSFSCKLFDAVGKG